MSEVNDIQRLTKYKDGRMEFDVDGNYCCFDDVEWIIKRLEQQKEELREFISSKLSEAWSKMGDTGSRDYMSKLNDENYWFGYFSALENAQDILNKYKQQEERDDNI